MVIYDFENYRKRAIERKWEQGRARRERNRKKQTKDETEKRIKNK